MVLKKLRVFFITRLNVWLEISLPSKSFLKMQYLTLKCIDKNLASWTFRHIANDIIRLNTVN